MAVKVKQKLKNERNLTFLARDFEAYRTQLINYARTFFPDKIQDFSEASLGGLLVDMASMVGDSLSFYLDHEFRELDPMLAVELDNVTSHLRNAGVEIYGASPATVELTFTLKVPSENTPAGYLPKISALPVLLRGTRCRSFDGISFASVDDLDFAEVDVEDNLVCEYSVNTTDTAGNPATYTVSRKVLATSGDEKSESFRVGNAHVPFREFTLTQQHISTIIDVFDGDGYEYYEVNALSQDTVFKAIRNESRVDGVLVPSNLEIAPAPRRFVKKFNPNTRLSTIRFGSGDASALDDDIIPDPSDLALNLYGKKYTPRFAIDPNSLLETQTLGISPRNTTIRVRYRYGGGASHNVAVRAISEINSLRLEFRKSPTGADALTVRQSIAVRNDTRAVGGANAPTVDELRPLISAARTNQARVVTRQDLLARVYTMPATFGKIFRASITANPFNPLSSLLYIISLDRNGNMTSSPDALKKNLSAYINEFRLISDAIDVLDGQVVNFAVKYEVYVAPNANRIQVVQNINNRLAAVLQRKYFQIDQPIVVDDITNVIINTDYVIALKDLRVFPRTGDVEGRSYSSSTFPFETSTKNGFIFGPTGAIFELKFPRNDIIGSAM